MKKNILFKIAMLLVLISISIYQVQAQTFDWAKNWDATTNLDEGNAIRVDANGIYGTGMAQQSSTNYEVATLKYNFAGTLQWSKTFDGINSGAQESGNCVTTDNHGNVWVAAMAYNTVDSKYHIALFKYTKNGYLRPHYPKFWNDAGTSIMRGGVCVYAVDSMNVYVCGDSYQSSTWNFTVLKDSVNTSGWYWHYTKAGGTVVDVRGGCANDLKANGSYVWATGWITNTTTNQDWWTCDLNASTGNQVWGTSYSGAANNDDEANALVIQPSGGNNQCNVYVVGYTTTATKGKDALIIKYNTTGGQVWSRTYDYNSLDDQYRCVTLGATCANDTLMVYAGGYVTNTANTDSRYITTAYNTVNGHYSHSWVAVGGDPVTYNGTGGTPKPTGTDQGYAISYEPTTNRVYITGNSFETISGTTSINITTIGYGGCSGSKVWSASYNYGTAQSLYGTDEVYKKYCLYTDYNGSTCVDDIYIEGNSLVPGDNYDYTTIMYDCPGCPNCDIVGPGDRVAKSDDEILSGLYPNPFTTAAVLNIDKSVTLDNGVLYIYDMTGKLVSSITNITKNNIIINKGNLKSGLYFYKLIDSGNILSNGKFVIAE